MSLAAAAQGGEDLGVIGSAAVDLMAAIGAPGVGVLLAVEAVFPPIPSEIVLPLAGFAANQGTFSLIAALAWATIGSMVGALLLYEAGRRFGRDRVLAIWLRLPLVDEHDFARTEAWFDEHGQKAVFFGRMVPLFRSLISIPAGTQRMPYGRFVLLTLAGSTLWNTAFILGGYLLGEEWHRIEEVAGWLQLAVVAAVVAAGAWWLVLRIRRRRSAADGGSSAGP
ncbi:VTT domain-containing protein [Nocardioides soli]|uniref:Membrane protein DedA with SNARE-associated domain n=1 Tax=Nocardioides soli TaxID=1036020 RepID=A0A7W4W0W8_9ACTN|nr:membrane protein DedA with SNARE-associated domain [Nocardioides soli]